MKPNKSPKSFSDASADHVARLIAPLAVDCVLDVGANEGQWAMALRRAGYTGRIISFEPGATAYARLREAATGDPRWQAQRTALGAAEGRLTLNRTRSSDLASALQPTRYGQAALGKGMEITGREDVPLRRLDGLLPEFMPNWASARLFLKMDTQGFDLEVFAGAVGVLPAIVGLQSELSVLPLYAGMPDWIAALQAFTQAGFAPTGFFPVVRTAPYQVLCEFDCVMARQRYTGAAPATTDTPPVTVVVTACADSPALRKCLQTVHTQAQALGGEVLLILNTPPEAVDDATHGALADLCDHLAFEPKVGKSHALNHAVQLSRGRVIAFTDDDAEPEPGWLAAVTAPLLEPDRDPALVGCGGPLLPIWPETAPAWFRPLIERNGKTYHFLTPIHDQGTLPLDYDLLTDEQRRIPPVGANCAYRREVFDSYHYDPRLGPNRDTGLRGGEDTLLAWLLLRDGYRLRYCPDARVHHPVHPERMTEACLRHSYYAHGVALARIQHLMATSVWTKAERRRELTRLYRKGARLRIQLFFLSLPFWRERYATRRMHLLGKYERNRGRRAEFKNPYSITSNRPPQS